MTYPLGNDGYGYLGDGASGRTGDPDDARFVDRDDISWTAWTSWVHLNGEVDLTGKCGRCAGTGAFVTYVENGVPKGPGGPCFRCNGKGWQSEADRKRNTYYDEHAAYRAIVSDLR